MGWFQDLSPDARERVRGVLLDLLARREAYEREYARLRPPPGTTPAGGAHIDPHANSEAIWQFVSLVEHRGFHPDHAGAAAKALASVIFRSWNQSRRDHQVHRWPQSCDAAMDRAVRLTLNAAEEPPCRSEASPSKRSSTPTTSAP